MDRAQSRHTAVQPYDGAMIVWPPPLKEPELLERLAMDDAALFGLFEQLIAAMPARTYDAAAFERALTYPWARPAGSYLLREETAEPLTAMEPAARERVVDLYTAPQSGRLPVLAIGSNASPETLAVKFAHFPDEEDRAVLALTGRLHDHDVGPSAQTAFYGALPATVFASPGTAVCATVLWVTPTQFTQLTWSELSYDLGRLRARFTMDDGDESFEEVLVFASRFGTFCLDGEPVALAAVPAEGRTAVAMDQEQLLEIVATLALGDGATAEMLVRAIYEEIGDVGPKVAATVRPRGRPFASEGWTRFSPVLPPAGG
jgi:hypothetical protein